MTIEYKDSKRITMLSTSSESLLTSSDYTSGNFTTVGSTVAITNNSVVFTNTPTNADNGQYKQITALAESDSYTLNFKLNISAHATFDNYFLYLSNTSGNPDASNALKIQTQGGSYNRFTFGTRLSGTNSEAQSSNNTASTGTDYYCTVTSDGSTATFKAWTNSGRTGTPSVTLTKSITGIGTLNYIQHRTRNSGDSNTWSGTVSEVALSKTLDKPTNVQNNSILVEKDTAKRYWFSAGTAISFEDDYTSNSGWTQTGSKVTVDSGKSDWVDANAAATNDSLQQVIKSLGITLSDTAWTADFTYINNGGTVGGYPFVFQSGTGNYDSASNDAITMSEDNPNKIKINTKNGGTYVAGSSTIAVSSGTTYYIRIQRTSATDIKLSAFTDSARTTHTSGSPVTASNAGIANITGLTYVQHQNQTTGGGGTSNFEITDLKIYNNSTSAPTTATWIGNFDLTGLKAYYKFDESSGNIINQATSVGSSDSLGSNADMTISGATYSQTGKIGNALSFDGSNDYGTLGSSLSQWNLFHGTGDWSINFWINYDEFVAEDRFFSNMDSTETRGINFAVGWSGNPDGQIGLSIKSDNGFMTNNGGINFPSEVSGTGTWVMITLVADYSDTTNTYTVYLNGVAGSSVARAVAGSTGDSEYSLKLACRGNTQDRFFDGLFDEMTIWSRVLTADEITSLYNANIGKIVF